MSYLVLARKWRPQTFEDLVGQEHVARTLQNAIRSERVAHAFLFCGMRGVGKTTAARLLAKALNCEKGPAPTPCNACSNCVEITAGSAVDVLEIDGASNRGINEVRQIIENVRYQPAKSRFKIYIIDEVHQVTHDAFNALLKTLEEPPAHVKFIFATTEAHKVPHTILSRCQRYDFKRIGLRQIVERLAEICRADEIEVSESPLLAVARESEGSMRDAQSLLDQVIAFAGKSVGDEDVAKALGIADRKVLYATANAIVERDAATALEHLGELHLFGYDLRRFARELLEHFRNVAVAQLDGKEDLLPDLSDEERRTVREHAQRLSSADVDRAFRVMMAAEEESSRSPYPKLLLEMALIKLATLPAILPIDDVLERLESLARGGGSTGGGLAPTPASGSPRPAGQPPPRRGPAPEEHLPHAAAPAAAAPPTGGEAGGWEAFLGFVAQEKHTLAPHLRQCAPGEIDNGRIELAVPAGFHHDYLARRDHLDAVESLAQQFYGRQVRVIVRAVERAQERETREEARREKLDVTKEALGHPKVRAAVDILGGEIQEVKAKTPREKSK